MDPPDDTFFQDEETVLEDFKKMERSDVVEDASELLFLFEKKYKKILKGQKKANVLITGITGAGKSSLINSIFKKNMASTGVGVSITKHFKKYTSKNFPIIIYDSRGLEHGNSDKYIEDTKKFLETHSLTKKHSLIKTQNEDNFIHVVWYVINSACNRWNRFEEKICRELFADIPIIFILNKADLSTSRDRNALRKCINNIKLKNCVGIYDVVSVNKKNCDISECSSCGSDDIVIRKKISQMSCLNCGNIESTAINNGRDNLVINTHSILPQAVKQAFASAQNVSIKLKDNQNIDLLHFFWDNWKHLSNIKQLLSVISNMMVQLSIVWNLKHSKEYGSIMASDFVNVMTNKKSINLLFHTDAYKQKIHCISIGILWNRCLYKLTKLLFTAWEKSTDHSNDNTICICSVDKVLQQFNGCNLFNIENLLQHQCFDTFIQNELDYLNK